jgi:hypothetical protein
VRDAHDLAVRHSGDRWRPLGRQTLPGAPAEHGSPSCLARHELPLSGNHSSARGHKKTFPNKSINAKVRASLLCPCRFKQLHHEFLLRHKTNIVSCDQRSRSAPPTMPQYAASPHTPRLELHNVAYLSASEMRAAKHSTGKGIGSTQTGRLPSANDARCRNGCHCHCYGFVNGFCLDGEYKLNVPSLPAHQIRIRLCRALSHPSPKLLQRHTAQYHAL